jgi:YcaO-like protein with predicted kinase domain
MESLLDERTVKRFRGGTDRAVPPAATVERARRLMGPLGITRIANVTGLDCIGIPVVMVCRPNARSLAVSQGKGLDLDAARASGLMESIELYHAERITLPLVLATEHELHGQRELVDVDRLPRLSVGAGGRHAKSLWIEGFDLAGQRRRLVPFEMVHANYTLPLPTGSGRFIMSSNGLASGNNLAEAVVHGLSEAIERDGTTLWAMKSEAQQEESRVDLSTIDDPGCRELLDRYQRAGVSVAVWDLTTDVGVAAFMCMIIDSAADAFRLMYPNHGMGCHPLRHIALGRALTEAAQSRLTLISGARDDRGRDAFRQAQDDELGRRVRERLARAGHRSFLAAPTFDGETFEDDLRHMIVRLQSVGIDQVAAVDLSRPELDIPVVRVVVPGLEPLFEAPGYLPGPRAQRVIDLRNQAQ